MTVKSISIDVINDAISADCNDFCQELWTTIKDSFPFSVVEDFDQFQWSMTHITESIDIDTEDTEFIFAAILLFVDDKKSVVTFPKYGLSIHSQPGRAIAFLTDKDDYHIDLIDSDAKILKFNVHYNDCSDDSTLLYLKMKLDELMDIRMNSDIDDYERVNIDCQIRHLKEQIHNSQ